MAELPHHRDGVFADREEEGSEGVAERVRGDPRRQRRQAARLEQLLGTGQDRQENPQANVVLGPRPSPGRPEDQLARAGTATSVAVKDEAASQAEHIMTSRIPAGVFECRTWIVEVAKSRSPQRRAASSWTRRPEETSVAMTGGRSSISQPGAASSLAAASSTAEICPADSRCGAGDLSILIRRRLPAAGLSSIHPYSPAKERSQRSTSMVLLIEVPESGRRGRPSGSGRSLPSARRRRRSSDSLSLWSR